VRRYERALYTAWGGRWQWEVGPGIWPIVPWFTEVQEISVARGIVATPRIDITLTDGRTLSAQASAVVRVVNLDKAVNAVDSFMESGQELLHKVVADKLSEAAAERLAPESRRRLLGGLKQSLNHKAAEFGLEFEELSFTTFVFSPRLYRVLSDGASVAPW
jgi:hypothetical protein